MASIAVKPEGLGKAARAFGVSEHEALADALGVHRSVVSRVLSGKSSPGPKFLAGAIQLFGWERFPDIFEVVNDPVEKERGAA